MGGSLTYQYLGFNAGTNLYDYRVTVTIYRYCSGNPPPSNLPTQINLGVYQNNVANPTGDKLLALGTTLPLISQQNIQPPPAGDSCSFTTNVCVEEGVYQSIVSLPTNTSGYYFIADRCCRNGNIVNLNNPGADGQAYYAFAPPTTIVNNSPTFAIVPVPFICANDTASILNQANDVDGDLLTYHLVTPYNGVSNQNTPNPTPTSPYPWPIPTVGYAASFSVANPFGAGGYASIDTLTGLTSYYATTQGFYVLAVEINEYRNGVLIGVTRRDLQIIVIICPTNPAPTQASTSLQTTFNIDEGQTLCFNSAFTDPNGDSIFITHTGDIFNALLTNPAATFTDVSNLASASSQFCWTTSCSQGRTNSYQFSVNARDNGCPAKITNIVYTINVANTQKPFVINGLDTICSNSATGIQYNVTSTSGYTYNWIINNGVIATGAHAASIGVNFTNPGLASVSIVALNQYGCPSDTLTKLVYIKALPSAVAGLDVHFCSGGNASLGTAAQSGYTYSWSPSTGLNNSTISNPTVSFINSGTTPQSTNYILTTNLNGCSNKDTVLVTSNPFPTASAGADVSICSGASISIGASSISGFTYLWTPSTGLNNATLSNPILTLTNLTNTPDTLTYIVQTQNSFACASFDTVRVTVRPVPVAVAGADISFCSGASGSLGGSTVNGYSYSWSPSTGLTSSTSSNSSISLTTSNTVNDTINYIVTASWFGCTNKDTAKVIVRPNPVSNAGVNQLLCSGSLLNLGTTNTSGYTYLWSPTVGLNNTTISNPTLTLNNVTTQPDTLFYVVTTTLNGCTTRDTARIVSSPVPVADAGSDITFCSGGNGNIGVAAVSGYVYSWSPVNGLSSGISSTTGVTLTTTHTTNDSINYILTTNLFGCIDKDTALVVVRPNPVSNAGLNQLLCSGNVIQLGTTSTSGYVYVWSPTTGLNNTLISNPTLTLSNTNSIPDTLNYLVTTTLNGCTTSDSVQIISSPVPNAVAGSDVTFCSGQSVSVGTTAISGYNYSWSPSTGLNSTTSATPTLTITNGTALVDTLSYIMSVNWYGCIDKDTVVAFVKPLPVSEAGVNTTLCNGDTLTLGTSATSGYTYSWTPSNGLNNSVISNPIATANNAGPGQSSITYTVNTLWNGCTTKDSVIVTVNPLPVVTAIANPQSICFGTGTTLNANGASSYSWALVSNPTVSIGSGNTLSITPTVSTSYILTGTSSVSCVNKDTILITVNPLPIVQLLSATDSICYDDTLSLSGAGANNYLWSISGVAGTIGSGNTIQVHPQTTTTYVLNGTDVNLCSNSDTLTIKVNPAPTANAIIGTLSVCPGVTGVQYWVSNSNPTSTYNWNVTNGTITSGQGSDTIMVDWPGVSGNGSVEVVEITDKGCQSRTPIILPITINVILTPVAPTGIQTICANLAQGILYSTISTPGSTYNWFAIGGNIVSGNSTNNVIVDWNVVGPQTVKLWYEETSVTNVTVCFGVSDTLTITINPIPVTSAITGSNAICVSDTGSYTVLNTTSSTYAWTITGGTILSGNGSNGITTNWTGSGAATVNVQETNSYGCLGNTVTIPITVNALPLANAGINDTICVGKNVQLAASGGTIYSWSPSIGLDNSGIFNPIANPILTTTYVVLVTDGNGCKNTDTLEVKVNPLPPANAGLDTSICIGSSTPLLATGGTSYLWSPSTGLNNPTIATPNANPTLNTTYTVIVTDANGCSKNDDVIVTVNPLPVAVASNDVVICAGSGINLTSSGGVGFQWTPSTGLNNANISNPFANPSNSTTYTVVVTDLNGCTDDEQVLVDINPQPKAAFTVDSTSIVIGCEGVEVSLINSSSYAQNYNWNFGDGTSSTDFNPQHLFGFGNDKLITLYAINDICSDSTSINFSPSTISKIIEKVSNIFTPNADGKNDCFNLGKQINFDTCSDWTVYNRWGQQVFHSSRSYPCWNGKKDNAGVDLPSGTYFYILQVAGNQYKGTISLIR